MRCQDTNYNTPQEFENPTSESLLPPPTSPPPHLPTLDRGGVQVQRLSNETWITIFTSDFPPQLCLNIGVIFPYNTKSQSLLGQHGVCLACGGLLITIQLREPFPIQLSQLPDELETKFYFSAAS